MKRILLLLFSSTTLIPTVFSQLSNKERMMRSLGIGSRPSIPSASSTLPGIQVFSSSSPSTLLIDSGEVWQNYSMAIPSWSTQSDLSFALWGGGNYASYAWGSSPTFIADYACQGAYIMEKMLAHGSTNFDTQVAAWWLATLPIANDGRIWTAQNAEWHVGHQGAWEGPGEILIQYRLYAAHTGDTIPYALAPERLVCVSYDNGQTFHIGGVPQTGVTDSICSTAPYSLPNTPSHTGTASVRNTSSTGTSSYPVPYFFVDTPARTYDNGSPSAGNILVHNSGRVITETITFTQAFTHISLALMHKVTNSNQIWFANVTILDVSTGIIVTTFSVQPSSPRSFGSAWTVIPMPSSTPPGTYLIVLTAEDTTPVSTKNGDSWFLGVSWVTNLRVAETIEGNVGGGAGQSTYGQAPLWTRNVSSSTVTAMVPNVTLNVASAIAVELQRVRASIAAGRQTSGGLGRNFADYAALSLSYILGLSSQLPVASSSNMGQYDVYVIPDPLYRGSNEPDVDTGCAYYDLLRIGFASSYINLRNYEGILAYLELQNANILPSSCTKENNAFGIDNGYVLSKGTSPCYTSTDVQNIANIIATAIGNRFSNSITGKYLDWIGCSCLGQPGTTVADCGLQDVYNGTLPTTGSGSVCLNSVFTDFLPSSALAAKLNIPAGGLSTTATWNHFTYLRDNGYNAGNSSYGPGWWHTAMYGLEYSNTPEQQGNTTGPGTWVANVGWQLIDNQGYAVHTEQNTGDWHFYSPTFIREGGPRGYGNHPTNAENGGKFFTTPAMIWEAHSAPGSSMSSFGPYTNMFKDWNRLLSGVSAIGIQIANDNFSSSLLPNDPTFLQTPVTDSTVNYLCAKVRKQFNFPNVTDKWNHHLCDYYSEIGWGTPENGVAFYSFAKGMLGLRPRGDGSLALLGSISPSPIQNRMNPWTVHTSVPVSWPAEVGGLTINQLLVNGVVIDITCTVGSNLLCTVTPV